MKTHTDLLAAFESYDRRIQEVETLMLDNPELQELLIQSNASLGLIKDFMNSQSDIWDILNDLELCIQKIQDLSTLFFIAGDGGYNETMRQNCLDSATELLNYLTIEAMRLVNESIQRVRAPGITGDAE